MKTVNSKNFLTRKIVANGKHQMVTFQNCEDFFCRKPSFCAIVRDHLSIKGFLCEDIWK